MCWGRLIQEGGGLPFSWGKEKGKGKGGEREDWEVGREGDPQNVK